MLAHVVAATHTVSLTVAPEHAWLRVDAYLAQVLPWRSRRSLTELLAAGAVAVNGRGVKKAHRLAAGDVVALVLPRTPEAELDLSEIPLRIVHEDDDLVVVDKPVGVAAHPSPGWTGPTVVGALAAAGFRISTSGAAERQGVVHRLDVGTSGLMVVAKSERAYTVLKRAFKERTVDKIYHAVVQGHPDPTRGTVDAPIGRHPGADYRFAVIADGKPSVTHYEVLEMFPAASLLEIHLETGRTHQIRVHMSALRHPCVGDLAYGADPTLAARAGLQRQWLHAMRLAFDHPSTGERLELSSAYPADLDSALTILRAGA